VPKVVVHVYRYFGANLSMLCALFCCCFFNVHHFIYESKAIISFFNYITERDLTVAKQVVESQFTRLKSVPESDHM